MQDKQKVVFAGEADQAPGTVPGDVVFVLQCKKHHQFHRKGDDLLIEHKVLISMDTLFLILGIALNENLKWL
jgi:DnaJ family protein A protein 2